MTTTTSIIHSPGQATFSSGRGVPIRRVVVAGVGAAALGAVAASLYGVAIRSAGVPMQAGFLGASSAQPLHIASFAMGVLVCTFWGTLLAGILGQVAAHPSRTFVRVTVSLAALSLIVPIGAAHTAGTTKAALIGAHLLAAVIVIPVLNRALLGRAGGNPGVQVGGVHAA
ncbi:MAG TPA: DUF6069 family protein [Acidimicrobiales bacterium]|nr:DUF6069 family protein [Acidimicrobiales bacterium]